MSKHYWKVEMIGGSHILGADEDMTDKEISQSCLGFGKVTKVSRWEAETLVERGMGFRVLTPDEVRMLKEMLVTISADASQGGSGRKANVP